MTRRPCLTPADLAHISDLCQQGATTSRIAEQLGFTYLQVNRALARQGLAPTPGCYPGRPLRTATSLVVSANQQQLITRWQLSGLAVKVLAQRIGVDWRQLSRELGGLKQMGPTRLRCLEKLLTTLPT